MPNKKECHHRKRHPLRVFLSHTSEFRRYPEKQSFIAAAEEAVNTAEDAVCDMKYFTARNQQTALYCEKKVEQCDVYVGIIGFRYGTPVKTKPEVSYTQL
ncbi:MAG: DUF4062 domain-containing protein [Deltaproteobacteria bacterium]|nr:DUF4062 domain-containing protein [Deltaproteobacteria bacterium]